MTEDPPPPENPPQDVAQEQQQSTDAWSAQHADRLRELEVDRWRLGERLEAMETEHSEVQAGLMEQVRALEAELLNSKAAHLEVQRARLADAAEARRLEAERLETLRREGAAELKHREERAEKLLEQLLQTKEALVTLSEQYHQEAVRQQAAALEQLSQLRTELAGELASQREHTERALKQLVQAKDDMLALQQAHASELAAARSDWEKVERRYRDEALELDKLASTKLELLRSEMGSEIAALRERTALYAKLDERRAEEQRALLAERDALQATLDDGQRKLAALDRLHREALAQHEATEQVLAELRSTSRIELEEAQRRLREAEAELSRVQRERDELSARASKSAEAAPAQSSASFSTEARHKLEQLERQLREEQLRYESMAHSRDSDVSRLRQSITGLEQEAARYRQSAAMLERKVTKTKDTLSFRLGYLLIHAPKSWEAMRRLPADLVELRNEARRRREARVQGRPRPPREGVADSTRKRPPQDFADEALRLFAAEGAEAAARFSEFGASDDHERALALTQLAKAIKSSDPGLAIKLADRAYQLEPVLFRAKWLAFLRYECGEIAAAASLVQGLPSSFALRPSEKARVTEIIGLSRVRQTPPHIPKAGNRRYEPAADSVLYVAASALPFHVSGYTVRTQSLLRAINSAGYRVSAVLRPGYPEDRGLEPPTAGGSHVVEGVSYQHVIAPSSRRIGLDEYIEAAAIALQKVIERTRPELVHAASNHVNALPALIAARRTGVPFVYEVRGMWELTAATRQANWEDSERFALERDLETLVACNADHVLTLTKGLADELASRGVEQERLTIIPNSVDPERFAPRRKDPELMLRLGLNSSAFTLVYAGSLLHYEGLDDLVRAIALLVQRDIDVALVIAGDGEAAAGLQQLAVDLQLDRRVKLIGRVAPDEIPRLWSLADAAAFPRRPFRVCDLVSPLKPLEPMVMALPVVVSDVAALREMVRDEQTGLVHRAGDATALAGKLERLALDPALRQRLGKAARQAVLAERTWEVAGERVVEIYRRLAPSTVAVVPLAAGRTSMSADEKALFDERLEDAFAIGGSSAVLDLATRQAAGRSDRLLAFCLLKAAGCCQRMNDPAALELARAALLKDQSAATLRGVARIIYAAGDFDGAAELVNRLEQLTGPLSGKDDDLGREVRSRQQLIRAMERPAATTRQPGVSGRSVYFLHFSLPYTSVGYATRSHGLIAGIQAAGCDVRPYTRCGFPHDFKPDLDGLDIPESDMVDGIEYRRLLSGGRRQSTESEYLLNSADAYEQVLRREQPEVVHAASNYITALPALIAARRLGLPFIYEIRGFWEITRSSRDNEFESSARYAVMRRFEDFVAREADHVFTLTSAMKAELMRRGVEENKISLVHNGVDAERFVPLEPRRELAEKLGLPSGVAVIGYIGSFVDYEGLDDLVHACGLLSRQGVAFRLLLVGDGNAMHDIQRSIAEEGIQDQVLLVGRVPHHEVEAYYSLVDICPFPRKPWEVCEMVSPLKPFEAMAMRKAVIVSSTQALTEIVEDGVNGLVFEKGNRQSLAGALQRAIEDCSLRSSIEQNGRSWVLAHRTWRAGGKVVVEGYRTVLDQLKDRGARVTA